jgi:hypothetical protein
MTRFGIDFGRFVILVAGGLGLGLLTTFVFGFSVVGFFATMEEAGTETAAVVGTFKA